MEIMMGILRGFMRKCKRDIPNWNYDDNLNELSQNTIVDNRMMMDSMWWPYDNSDWLLFS